MAAPFDLNDDSVVVVIGSGAGGGTLGTELALKGVQTISSPTTTRLRTAWGSPARTAS
jgi:hypothetical protein